MKITRIILALALAGLVAAPAGASAAVSTRASATTSADVTTSTKPAPSTIAPSAGVVADTQVQHVVQLSNLTVSAVAMESGSGTVYIIATSANSTCTRFSSEAALRGETCRIAPVSEYTIEVGAGTKVLGKARAPLSVAEIQAGDRINVYGYMNVTTGVIRALILRDLDRPESVRTVQLENLRVFSVGKDGNGGLNVLAGTNVGNCYDWTASLKRPFACPLGHAVAEKAADASVSASGRSSLSMYRPAALYSVSVPANARIIDVNRRPVLDRVIREGDVINVYGTLRGKTVVAEVVRIISRASVAQQLNVAGSSQVQLARNQLANVQITASGGVMPYSWAEDLRASEEAIARFSRGTVAGMPPGLTLTTTPSCESTGLHGCLPPASDASMAWITGVPRRSGSYYVTVVVKDDEGAVASHGMLITVSR